MTDTITTASTFSGESLTAESIMSAIRDAEKLLNANPMRDVLFGMPVKIVESPYATRTIPKRTHKKRRNQSASYHRRIQKKWNKRYGMKTEQCAFVIDNRFLGGFGQTLVMQPHHAAMIRGLSA